MLCMLLKTSLSRLTNFVFRLLEWLSLLVTTKVLVRMHKIHVKKDSSEPKFAHRVEIAGLRDS